MPIRVAQIWRYPVKSMGGEEIEDTRIGQRGIPFDRGWAVRDERTQLIRSARYIPRLLLCSARYVEGTDAGLVPHVEITLPDGSTVMSDDSRVNRRLSDAIGRNVSLRSLRPEEEIDHLRHNEHSLETGDMMQELRMQFGLRQDDPLPDMTAFPAAMARQLMETVSLPGTFFDCFPLNVITTSAIRQLQRLVPDADLDIRRFRANLLIDDMDTSNVISESDLPGNRLYIGNEAALDVVIQCPRCTMVAAPQPGLERASNITRGLVENMHQMLSVYCDICQPGLVRVGDTVSIRIRTH